MGHSLSVAMQNHHQKRWSANNMYTDHTEQDSEAGLQENMGD